MEAIDKKPVVRLEFLVMGSGDLFSYGLSENYELVYRDLIFGGEQEQKYCIGTETAKWQ